ncbi:MAG: circularly permuted type 2 ATP-grasp protein [Kineosporiaceae bacterium]
MVDPVGGVRDVYRGVHAAIAELGTAGLRARADALASTFLDRGVTFDLGGEERPFPLDIVPRVIPGEEWRVVEAGVTQRVHALERFLADVYGPMSAVRDGVVPRAVLMSSPHLLRQAAGIEPPNGVRVHVSGTDLVRDVDGRFRVLEDNIRVPSGVSYVMENRLAMTQVFPEAFAAHRVRPVSDYPERLLQALKAAAPAGVDNPTVVLLTPGVYNSAYFEHALLARSMGVELVVGRDLVCTGNRVRMLTTDGERRVDVVYRRIDDDFLDPLHFRADSMLGCPGLLNAARAGNVTIANAVGNGVADDKLLYTYVPDLIRYYLGEEPVLDNVPTWRLAEPEARAEVLDRLGELVVKPVDGSGGKGIVIGPAASRPELDELRHRLQADPRGWIAQPVVALSTTPTLVGHGLAPRHVDLRPFAVNSGERVWVLPGGLTRVALREATLVVNSSQGGGSKDTWVVAVDEPADGAEEARVRSTDVEVVRFPASEPGPGTLQVHQQSAAQSQGRSREGPC